MAEIVWSSALVALLAFEGYTIWLDKKKETTLSFFVIKLRANAAYRSALVGSFMWLAWHWFLEPDLLADGIWSDDLMIIAAAIFGTLTGRNARKGMR